MSLTRCRVGILLDHYIVDNHIVCSSREGGRGDNNRRGRGGGIKPQKEKHNGIADAEDTLLVFTFSHPYYSPSAFYNPTPITTSV